MFAKIFNFFSKDEDEVTQPLPKNERVVFTLKIDHVEVGKLRCENGVWEFTYSDKFKNEHYPHYKRIAGFPEINKVYKKETLWPFFLVRIPGLKQPAIKEIIEKEKIDTENEAALLKRFGQKSISNPYELIPN
jgi:HipA-like protein